MWWWVKNVSYRESALEVIDGLLRPPWKRDEATHGRPVGAMSGFSHFLLTCALPMTSSHFEGGLELLLCGDKSVVRLLETGKTAIPISVLEGPTCGKYRDDRRTAPCYDSGMYLECTWNADFAI